MLKAQRKGDVEKSEEIKGGQVICSNERDKEKRSAFEKRL